MTKTNGKYFNVLKNNNYRLYGLCSQKELFKKRASYSVLFWNSESNNLVTDQQIKTIGSGQCSLEKKVRPNNIFVFIQSIFLSIKL